MPSKDIFVIKADGKRDAFKEDKLRTSLLRAGARQDDIERTVDHVRNKIREGMNTSDIYRFAFETLRRVGQPVVSRYSMKRAVFGLGPSGFPFERFVAEIFRSQGYDVETDVTVQGKCVEHEIDLAARGKDVFFVAEVKFHNRLGIKSDLKVPLYVKSRFDDIAEVNHEYSEGKRWLVTNTKFSKNALIYGGCVDIHMVDWNHPADGNLQNLIARSGVQPVTCLTSVNDSDKKKLIDSGIVLCRHVQDHVDDLERLGISKDKADQVLAESEAVCSA